MSRSRAPLYRKVNTRARGVYHHFGGDFRHQRATEKLRDERHGTMHGQRRRGLDYTPLFQSLRSKVGEDWNVVFREAVTRLDRPDPIFWVVSLEERNKQDYVCVGDSSYFSGLFVDHDGRLQLAHPALCVSTLTPSCGCCTHTLNGIPFTRKWKSE
jgi:hypothetical protein